MSGNEQQKRLHAAQMAAANASSPEEKSRADDIDVKLAENREKEDFNSMALKAVREHPARRIAEAMINIQEKKNEYR